MGETKNYEVGQVFKSLRSEDEAFVITEIEETTKTLKTGKVSSTGSSYIIGYIPEIVSFVLPSGVDWVHVRKPFPSNDEIIAREIALGNWEVIE